MSESTLRRLTSAVKDFLAAHFEFAKQLQEQLLDPVSVELSSLRTIFYDEGFIKLLGANGFIIFTLDGNGRPINISIQPRRDAETIHGHFMQVMTQQGGVDIIIADGASAALAAAKALRQRLILVQHIHKGKGKRARIIKLDPIPNRKSIWHIPSFSTSVVK